MEHRKKLSEKPPLWSASSLQAPLSPAYAPLMCLLHTEELYQIIWCCITASSSLSATASLLFPCLHLLWLSEEIQPFSPPTATFWEWHAKTGVALIEKVGLREGAAIADVIQDADMKVLLH